MAAQVIVVGGGPAGMFSAVTAAQAGTWTVTQMFDDYFGFAIDGEWLITFEYTGHCCDYIRAVCTGDSSFTSLKFD